MREDTKRKRIADILEKLAAYQRQGLVDIADAMALVQCDEQEKRSIPIGSPPSLSVFTDDEITEEANRRLLAELDAEQRRFELQEYHRLRAKYEHE